MPRLRPAAVGRPVPRGARQHLPPRILVPPLAGVAVLGWSVPLLGIPLTAFAVADAVPGGIAHRGGRRRYGAAA
ncbi:hypothetical protein ACF1B0_22505 [Streptomyces anandii]|uniref:hypothetical protein n=1 Tax=Streptomyces anandii TaxID=285454 RepID=UPI0036FC6E4C